MNKSSQQRQAERLEQLWGEVSDQLLSQVTGPFGLSQLTVKDLNGGNVTTLHNFSRADADYVATDADRARHAHANADYERSKYEVKTNEAAEAAGCAKYEDQRAAKVAQGTNEYNGNPVGDRPQLDHVRSLKSLHDDKEVQLGMTTVDDAGKVGVSKIAGMAHHEDNLKLTDGGANASKGSRELGEWSEERGHAYDLDPARVAEAKAQADKHVDSTAAKSLRAKQMREVGLTGLAQGGKMGLKQAFGVLFSELTKRLIREVRKSIRGGVKWTKALLKSIGLRLVAVAKAVVLKWKSAAWAMLDGGVSGFVSNLITFLVNKFVSTAKRFVTMIREGLSGIVKAFKTMFFPQPGMTPQQALQAGLQILSATVTTACGVLLTEAVQSFIGTVPLLVPIADVVAGALVGGLTGLLTAFLAYRIDKMFDSSDHQHRERVMNLMQIDATRQQDFIDALTNHVQGALGGVERYMASIASYQSLGAGLGRVGRGRDVQLASLRAQGADVERQRASSKRSVERLEADRARVAAFLTRSK